MKKVLILLALPVFFSCNSGGVSREKKDVTVDTTAGRDSTMAKGHNESLISGCYQKISQRDSIVLNVQERDSVATGHLAFKNYQKDSSHGTVKGRTQNGNLVLWYEFESEGTHSVMQVVFKPTPDGMIRGVGEMLNRGDSVFFKNLDAISFDQHDLLIRVKCPGQ